MKSKFIIALYSLAVMAITTLPFFKSHEYGIVYLDEPDYILEPQQIKEGLTPETLKWAFTTAEAAIWMPLTRISYAFDWMIANCFLWSKDELFCFMHIHSLILHALGALILFYTLLLLAKHLNINKPHFAAILATLAWSVHPLRCESVVWIAARKDVLSFLWFILAVFAWVKLLVSTSRLKYWRSEYYYATVVFFIGSTPKLVENRFCKC